MLSIGCATGEEAVSMVAAACQAGLDAADVTVDGVDSSRDFVEAARGGVYRERSLREDAPSWAMCWLTLVEGELRVSPQIMECIHYHHADVLRWEDVPNGGKYRIIFCRNLSIYLNRDARKRLIDRVIRWLAPGGYLFAGHAEHSAWPATHFQPLSEPHAFALERLAQERPEVSGWQSLPDVVTEPVVRRAERPASPDEEVVPEPVVSSVKEDIDVQEGGLDDARLLANSGRLDEARAAAEGVLRQDGPCAETFELLGFVHMSGGNMKRAREWFEKAVYLEPGREASLLQLAIICEKTGETDQAERYRRRARKAHRGTREEEE
jgi:chemotaxis protein methyltransferase WspC